MVYSNLTAPTRIASGLSEFALIAPLSTITTQGVPTAPFTNPGDSITITTEHTFATGKGFNNINLHLKRTS